MGRVMRSITRFCVTRSGGGVVLTLIDFHFVFISFAFMKANCTQIADLLRQSMIACVKSFAKLRISPASDSQRPTNRAISSGVR
jgi:hypothetical protein